MPGYGSDELVPLDRVDPEWLEGSHGRRTRDLAEKGDLPEGVTLPELPSRTVLELNSSLSGGYRVEVVAGLAAGDDDLARSDRDGCGPCREALEHGLGQLRKDRDSP